jgi:NAD(P)-dependent dehydrogenase (short-subunit alcohol dehydrogenase family)
MTELNNEALDLSTYQPATDYLAGKSIMVTGAGDGIGKAIALSLAQHGATVTLLGRTEKKLEATYDAIELAGGPQAAICPFDLLKADEAAYQQLAEILNSNFARLDGIVHCAAILGSHSPIANTNYPLWHDVLQVNLTAPFLISRACYSLLLASDHANIIFTSDKVAVHGTAYWGAYSVAKAGQDNLMQILASEWENNTPIQVASLDPGPVRTRLRKQVFPGEDPTGLPSPSDTVLPYLYLLDTQQDTPTGQRYTWDFANKTLTRD